MISVAQLIVNISGTIAQSNQTNLINTSNDWSFVNIATILLGFGSVLGIIAALVISRVPL
jgi:hypothetical protein